ncbi:MAG: restriction endonuclease subunit S [Acidimicrobiia bacterium]
MTVEYVRVGDLLKLHRRAVEVDPSGEYQEVGVRSFGRGIFRKEPIAGTDLGSKRVFRIEPGDLVISNVFAWEGAIAVASEAEEGMIGSHRFMTFRPKDDRTDTAWLAWFFLSEPGLELIRRASPGSAGRNRTLAIERFEALEIPLPPIDEQRRVAQHLSATSAASNVITDLARSAQKLSDALAVSIATRPDLDDTAKRRAGWIPLPLGELLVEKTQLARSLEPDGRYPIAGIYSFGRGLIDRGVIAGSETSYKTLTRLDADDVVFSKLNAWEGAVTVVPPRFDGFFVSSEYPTFGVNHARVDPRFLDVVLRSPAFWGRMNDVTQGSMVRRRRINTSQFLGLEIWIPSADVQTAACELIAQLASATGPRKEGAQRLSALLPAAMNEAFSGLS